VERTPVSASFPADHNSTPTDPQFSVAASPDALPLQWFMAPNPDTIRQTLIDATAQLREQVDAEWLLAHAVGRSRSWLFTHASDLLEQEAAERYAGFVARRLRGEPVAYIIGTQGFWSLELSVTSATLIPRPETERLVELVLERMPRNAACRVVDLGTGSGAIALALATERPLAEVTAVDNSRAALDVARANAARLGLSRIRFVAGNWLEPLAGEQFDIIASNPPYIESDDPHLTQGDLRFEPLSALAAGLDGLQDLRIIVHEAHAALHAGGWLLLEHGWKQGPAVRALFDPARWAQTYTALDLEQRERVTLARRR
jgi:release factor glutamine methyltransferase